MMMFDRHVSKKLSAYCHGEISREETRRVTEHLSKCGRCREECEDIKLGINLAKQLPHVTAPESLWSEIESALDGRAASPALRSDRARSFFGGGWPRFATATAALLFVVASFAIWYFVRPTGPYWSVENLAGSPRVGSDYIKETGRIGVGQVLVTDDESRARISVGMIGQVEVDPNSRVRLLDAHLSENRLELERGRLKAKISAPPRLFFVNIPSAEAVDLGCAYTLEVDDAGRGLLHVTSGWVALVRDGRESFVPIGAMCESRPQSGPGTPYFDDASDTFREALERFDFENGGDAALSQILEEARDRDTFTLWHLFSRVDEERRARVFDRMVGLVGLPKGITRDGIMHLDKGMLELWKDELDLVWF